jgi:acetyl esterase/lipase
MDGAMMKSSLKGVFPVAKKDSHCTRSGRCFQPLGRVAYTWPMRKLSDLFALRRGGGFRRLGVSIATLIFSLTAAAETPPAAGAKPAAAKDAKAPTPAIKIPPDAGREQAIQDELARRLPGAEIVLLDVDKAKVVGLYREQTARQARGAVLLLPGMDRSADDPGLVRAFREALPKVGWSTFSLQLPLLPPGSPREAYGGVVEPARKRIQAALAQLAKLQQKNIVVVGIDLGGALALLTAPDTKDMKGVVALSLDFVDGLNPAVDPSASFDKLKVPVFDIYGALAGESATRLAAQRRSVAGKVKQLQYAQVALDGRNSRLDGDPSLVVNRVIAWLRKLKLDAAASATQPSPP